MFLTKKELEHIIGDKIKGFYVIKDINLLSKVLITDGKQQKFYSFSKNEDFKNFLYSPKINLK